MVYIEDNWENVSGLIRSFPVSIVDVSIEWPLSLLCFSE